MAYTKIKPIKSGTHLQKALDYVQNPNKTDERNLTFSYMCSIKTAFSDFEIIKESAIKKGNNIAHHICQSFSPNDNITPQQALNIGIELMKKIYPNHQYVIATHIDRGHIHNHILVNSVSFDTFRKINSNKESLGKMRRISDDICKENGLSIIKPIPINHRKKLRETINKNIDKSQDFNDFLSLMQADNYSVKIGKNLSFKSAESEIFMRTALLGTAYTEMSIKKRIGENKVIKNSSPNLYNSKMKYTSNRKKLKFLIDDIIRKSDSFDEFLNKIKDNDCEIKQGKHLAFRLKNSDRFIRIESIGKEYSEDMIRLRFMDYEEYERAKEEFSKKVDKIVAVGKNYYTTKKNIDEKIKTINFLKQNNISSIEELDKKISDIQSSYNETLKEISNIKKSVSEKFDIINAGRIYWQYKPYGEQLRTIKSSEMRKKYLSEHKTEIDKLKKAVDIMNKAREDYGELPKSNFLYKEIEQLNLTKEKILAESKKTKSELTELRNVKYNLEHASSVDEEIKNQEENHIRKDNQKSL